MRGGSQIRHGEKAVAVARMNSCRAPSHNRTINSSESPEIRKVENNYLTGGILFSLARCLLMGAF